MSKVVIILFSEFDKKKGTHSIARHKTNTIYFMPIMIEDK